MEYCICSVRDAKVGLYMRPFVSQSKGAAIRSFGDECVNKESVMFAHPEDFELYVIGSFEDTTSQIVCCAPVLAARAVDYVSKESKK